MQAIIVCYGFLYEEALLYIPQDRNMQQKESGEFASLFYPPFTDYVKTN
jgi:hypothetical protein